jgi:hypothetical protein
VQDGPAGDDRPAAVLVGRQTAAPAQRLKGRLERSQSRHDVLAPSHRQQESAEHDFTAAPLNSGTNHVA